MPTFDYACTSCHQMFEDFSRIAERDDSRVCPHCGVEDTHSRPILQAPRVEGDLKDWSGERDKATGLHGRYCPQAAKFPGDKRAVFKDCHSFIEWGKRKGYSVHKE